MILDILKQLNWVDFLVIIVMVRIIYIALSSGFPLELFKLMGTFASLYLSMHYFTFFTDWMGARNPGTKERVPLQFMDFFSLVALAVLGYLIFLALRLVFDKFIKMEINQAVSKSVALLLGVVRGFLLASLVAFVMVVSDIGYLKDSVKSSYTGRRVCNAAVNTYSWTWNHLTSRFALGENFNKTVTEIQKTINP